MSKQPIYETPGDVTSPIVGYSNVFIPEEGGDYDGKYVDFPYSDEDLDKITSGTGTHFHDAAIIPTIQYQVFGIDKAWFWDNEGQNYSYSGLTSSISIKVIDSITTTVTKTYYDYLGETTDSLTDEQKEAATRVTSVDSIPSEATEGTYYYTETTTEEVSYADEVVTSPYEFNKYGKEPNGKLVEVSITPNSTLVQSYPNAIVTVNGKEYDLSYLAPITKDVDDSGTTPVTTYTAGDPNKIVLYMNKDYRIAINWVWGEKVEVFRIICNR